MLRPADLRIVAYEDRHAAAFRDPDLARIEEHSALLDAVIRHARARGAIALERTLD